MKSTYKMKLLAGASVAAFGLGLAFAPAANAFNKVNWTWDAHIDETITKTVDINIVLDPTGMVMLEDLQVFIGDVKAESKVFGIQNNQPLTEEQVSGPLEVQWHYGLGGVLLDDGFNSPAVTDANVDETDQMPNINGTVTATIDLGELDPASFDALTELPEVVSAATAVANNTSIESDTAVQLHEGQFVFGDGDLDDRNDNLAVLGATLFAAEAADAGVNSNLIGAGVLGILAIAEAIDPAKIEAKSEVGYILNATVDSSATAVANNLTVDVQAEGSDRLFIGDVVQFAYADVEAKSKVYGVTINNYTNLGMLDRPIVSSVATAVGNNKSISVSAPAVSVAP